MVSPSKLPSSLFIEMGKTIAIWAHIEQDLLIHTSAMGSLETAGKTTEYLRLDFKRLRQRWYDLCRENFDPAVFNKTIHPLYTDLVTLSQNRGHIVHGVWEGVGRTKYKVTYWEQKNAGLQQFQIPMTLAELRNTRGASAVVAKKVKALIFRDHGDEDVTRPLIKTTTPLKPGD